jgi:hypothetical protein
MTTMNNLENNSCARLSLRVVLFLGATAAFVGLLILAEMLGRMLVFWP